MKTATVITPTIGKPEIREAIKSVAAQTYKTEHLIVSDGHRARMDFFNLNIKPISGHKVTCVETPINTGAGGFNGQRIYAAYPHLLDSDYILFLDEDNWYEPNHVESLIKTIEENNLPFAYSLRSVYNKEGDYLCNDECESLGKWEIFFTRGTFPQFMVDTSSYCFTRQFIQASCHLWHSGAWGEDRRYYNAVKLNAHDTSGKYTLCYRLDGNPKSVTEEFFKQGNKIQKEYYGGKFPWRKT